MDVLAALAAPFHPDLVEWRDGPKRTRLAYVDVRVVRERLNDVCGAGWQSKITLVHAERFQAKDRNGNDVDRVFGYLVCELSVKIDGEWITRTDAADPSDIESIKGMASDALKRAAFSFKIGEYLYQMPDNVRGDQAEYEAAALPYIRWRIKTAAPENFTATMAQLQPVVRRLSDAAKDEARHLASIHKPKEKEAA